MTNFGIDYAEAGQPAKAIEAYRQGAKGSSSLYDCLRQGVW